MSASQIAALEVEIAALGAEIAAAQAAGKLPARLPELEAADRAIERAAAIGRALAALALPASRRRRQ